MAALSAFHPQLWDGATLGKADQPLPCAGPGVESPVREGWLRMSSPCPLHLVLLNGVEPGSSVGYRLLDLAGLRWVRPQSHLPKVQASTTRRKTSLFLASHPSLCRARLAWRMEGSKGPHTPDSSPSLSSPFSLSVLPLRPQFLHLPSGNSHNKEIIL